MLFVRMLTIIMQRMSRSIQTKEACPPVITAASRVNPTQISTTPKVEDSEEAANKSYTSDGFSGSTASAEVCSCQLEW
jgi:hypothetical protein